MDAGHAIRIVTVVALVHSMQLSGASGLLGRSRSGCIGYIVQSHSTKVSEDSLLFEAVRVVEKHYFVQALHGHTLSCAIYSASKAVHKPFLGYTVLGTSIEPAIATRAAGHAQTHA